VYGAYIGGAFYSTHSDRGDYYGHTMTAQDATVCNAVTCLILDGGIAPGQVVTIQNLAEAFGVSTMPVREALKRLTAAGALSLLRPHSGPIF
jgi:DNA-binding GntR family transcriptional regulator